MAAKLEKLGGSPTDSSSKKPLQEDEVISMPLLLGGCAVFGVILVLCGIAFLITRALKRRMSPSVRKLNSLDSVTSTTSDVSVTVNDIEQGTDKVEHNESTNSDVTVRQMSSFDSVASTISDVTMKKMNSLDSVTSSTSDVTVTVNDIEQAAAKVEHNDCDNASVSTATGTSL
jgi:hypothetical protein